MALLKSFSISLMGMFPMSRLYEFKREGFSVGSLVNADKCEVSESGALVFYALDGIAGVNSEPKYTLIRAIRREDWVDCKYVGKAEHFESAE